MSVMLYKYPGIHELHGDKFDYIVVDESEVDTKLKEGWFKTTPEAKESSGPIEHTETIKHTRRRKQNVMD